MLFVHTYIVTFDIVLVRNSSRSMSYFCAQLQCCGSAGPLDWALSVHNGYTINTKVDLLSIQSSGNHYHHQEKRLRILISSLRGGLKCVWGCYVIGFEHPRIS